MREAVRIEQLLRRTRAACVADPDREVTARGAKERASLDTQQHNHQQQDQRGGRDLQNPGAL